MKNRSKRYNVLMNPRFSLFSALIGFTFMLLLAISSVARAQVPQSEDIGAYSTPAATQAQAATMDDEENSREGTVVKDNFSGSYQQSTIENLSRLYWRLAAFDLGDSISVGNYIKINDCQVYSDYIHDDMQWKEIIKVMQAYLAKNKHQFPVKFQFMVELNLGRYDQEKGGFPVAKDSGFSHARRIEVSGIQNLREVCYDQSALVDYPQNVSILLDRPFDFNFIPVDEHVAQAYILRKKAEYAMLDDREKVSQYERNAYLRLRVTFHDYKGSLRIGALRIPMAVLSGTIDGFEVFEDRSQKRIMFGVEREDKNAPLTPKTP